MPRFIVIDTVNKTIQRRKVLRADSALDAALAQNQTYVIRINDAGTRARTIDSNRQAYGPDINLKKLRRALGTDYTAIRPGTKLAARYTLLTPDETEGP